MKLDAARGALYIVVNRSFAIDGAPNRLTRD